MTPRVLALAVAALASCGGGGGAETTEPIERAEALPLQMAFQGLCNAKTLAEAQDMWGAANEFNIHAHNYLHEFADRLSSSDREAAGVLLEAKQSVEAQLNTPDDADPAATASALTRLQEALADGAEREGFERPGCGTAAS